MFEENTSNHRHPQYAHFVAKNPIAYACDDVWWNSVWTHVQPCDNLLLLILISVFTGRLTALNLRRQMKNA